MKLSLILISFTLFCLNSNGQLNKNHTSQTSIKIHCTPPKFLTMGSSIKLKVQVSHQLVQEKIGQLTLSITNPINHQSVDGWFTNIFPFQYFTTIKNEKFETEFPITVPYDYKGDIAIDIVARVNEFKDSVHISLPIKKQK